MESISSLVDSSMPNMEVGPVIPISGNPISQQLSVSDKQMGLVESLSGDPGEHKFSISKQMEPNPTDVGSQSILVSFKQPGPMGAMLMNPGSQQLLMNKQTVPIDSMCGNLVSQQMSMPNMRVAQIKPASTALGFQSFSVPNRATIRMPSVYSPGSQRLPTPNKKMGQTDSISNKSGARQLSLPKSRTTRMEPSPKARTESFESVRSKLRESLAVSLALVSEQQNKSSDKEISHIQQDKPATAEKDSQDGIGVVLGQTHGSLQPVEPTGAAAEDAKLVPEQSVRTTMDKTTYHDVATGEGTMDSTQTWKCAVSDFESANVVPVEDVSFSDSLFVKDELLQGNGLSWALDLDMVVDDTKEIQATKKQKLGHTEAGREERELAVCSPEIMAFKIEAELFKLFGGVNKKYKEKGRSLLFNLKDRNNPELREKVMSGEISPERLCSMTAEELASKELSEWRIAKAEELAQMVVLPDSEVDLRRLVKKTHKGEFRVEVDQDDSMSVEVSFGASSLTQVPSKSNETQNPSVKSDAAKDGKNVTGEKSTLESQNGSCSLTILPSDGADLLQGLMADELKDAEFLPPIVSLDEFMESLDSEPPFENISLDAGKTNSMSDKDGSIVGPQLKVSGQASRDSVNTNPDKLGKVKLTDFAANVKSNESHLESESSAVGAVSKGELVWEGLLQLNVSAMATVTGFFRSGEKTSTKEWPSFLEIKGRVRRDAFEKFIQELPNSRSRAIMVALFLQKEGSPESERTSLAEVIEAYVSDERLGFAEPAPGVELYLCPPHAGTLELLSKHLPREYTETLNATDIGLIGIVVWRKAHLTSTISPKSSSHHKHSSKKQQYSSRRQQEKETNVNVNYMSRLALPHAHPEPTSDDENDVPPGFGPAAARDDDDLPEFKFSGSSNASLEGLNAPTLSQGMGMTHPNQVSQGPPRPADQMRELIQKYGQPGTSATPRNWQDKRGVGVAIQPWDDDDDDDDDIPEWQPQVPKLQSPPMPTPQQPPHNFQQQMPQPNMLLNQQPLVPLAVPQAMLSRPSQPSWQQGAWWAAQAGSHSLSVQGSGLQSSIVGCPPNEVQFLGMPRVGAGHQSLGWRQDAPRSRGL